VIGTLLGGALLANGILRIVVSATVRRGSRFVIGCDKRRRVVR